MRGKIRCWLLNLFLRVQRWRERGELKKHHKCTGCGGSLEKQGGIPVLWVNTKEGKGVPICSPECGIKFTMKEQGMDAGRYDIREVKPDDYEG